MSSMAFTSSKQTPSVVALQRWSCIDTPLPEVSQIEEIHIYDFDNTLFHTPTPNRKLWHSSALGKLMGESIFANGGWWHDPSVLASTGEGIEKEEPRAWAGFWNETLVELVQLSRQQGHVLTVLLTGRGEQRFADLIKRMVRSKGLKFDMICLKRADGSAPYPTTMAYKKSLIKEIMLTYHHAREIRIYEDRQNHVREFQEFLSKFNTNPLGRLIDGKVIPVRDQASTLDNVTEVCEVQRMVNAHNVAYLAGSLGSGAFPYQLKAAVDRTCYALQRADTDKFRPFVPSAAGIDFAADEMFICMGVAPSHILSTSGKLGTAVRFRVDAVGNLETRIWAARVIPLKGQGRPRNMILATATGSGATFRDINQITNWRPVHGIEFDATVTEKQLIVIEQEYPPGQGAPEPQPEMINVDSPARSHPPAQPKGNGTHGGQPYRGGNGNRGRGQHRREPTRGGRGGGHRGGGGGRRGRGRGQRGYTDYDAGGHGPRYQGAQDLTY
ncbi:hypothetical protein EJ06DRAFT_511388 [Trichodelitschia bisporula]|uniref:Swiss Army Knife RNA repair protein HAD domain-containing protein n=1 Tax=Trichodelitschia bisporula TaxID=703511 RepID=A0A6G1HVT8_9PEZI|nr:hypothetical protein EJ06DRAFT_511388 [Trichodelitschia bisporula]